MTSSHRSGVRWIAAGLAALSVAVGLSACGGTNDQTAAEPDATSSPTSRSEPAPEAAAADPTPTRSEALADLNAWAAEMRAAGTEDARVMRMFGEDRAISGDPAISATLVAMGLAYNGPYAWLRPFMSRNDLTPAGPLSKVEGGVEQDYVDAYGWRGLIRVERLNETDLTMLMTVDVSD